MQGQGIRGYSKQNPSIEKKKLLCEEDNLLNSQQFQRGTGDPEKWENE
jgi:hypothetical protein